MDQEKFNRWDTIYKFIGLFFIIVSGIFAYIQYENNRHEKHIERELAIINDIFKILTDIDTAKTDKEKEVAVAKFWIILQGKARIFLDPKIYSALETPRKYVQECVARIRPVKDFNCSNYTGSMSAFGFSKVVKDQLSL